MLKDLILVLLRSWVPFVDAMFQLQLMKDTSRCLLVPTAIERLTCVPGQLKKAIEEGVKVLDQVTVSDASLIDVRCDAEMNFIQCQGVTIKGFKGSVLQRK